MAMIGPVAGGGCGGVRAEALPSIKERWRRCWGSQSWASRAGEMLRQWLWRQAIKCSRGWDRPQSASFVARVVLRLLLRLRRRWTSWPWLPGIRISSRAESREPRPEYGPRRGLIHAAHALNVKPSAKTKSPMCKMQNNIIIKTQRKSPITESKPKTENRKPKTKANATADANMLCTYTYACTCI